MNIAYVTTYDAHDPSVWAGSGYHIAKALEKQGLNLHYIGPLHERGALPLKVRQLAYQKLLGVALHRDREPVVLEGYARQIEQQLARIPPVDLIFSPGTVAIGRLRTDKPIVCWTDATYGAIVDEYIWEPRASRRSLRLGDALERDVLTRRAALAIYCSDWAARSAIDRYGTDPAKVKVVPFGANVAVTRTRGDVERSIDSRDHDVCRLLFIGVGWERKGADRAMDVARAVNARGLRCELTMLGQSPPPGTKLPEYVKHLGFIDKRKEEGRRRFDELFGASHFLLLPARAEAFGVVLCEACSFGVPCLAGRVGGIPTIVREDVNGRTFPRDCDPDEYAKYVVEQFADTDRYRNLARGAFDEYESRLNWDVAGRTVKGMLEELLQS
jgi:glycosyltransferase involved in cell wall biosynthesis